MNLEGKQFGRLIVLEMVDKSLEGHAYWSCFCVCGNYTRVRQDKLMCGRTQSCGCLRITRRKEKK